MPPRAPNVGLPGVSALLSTIGKGCYEVAVDAAQRGMSTIRSLKLNEEDKLVNKMYVEEKHRRTKNKHQGLPSTYMPDSGVDLETVRRTKYRRLLGTDIEASEISMGMSAAAGTYRNIDENTAIKAVQEAYRLGINYFDTAPLYGYDRSGEYLLGEALKGKPRNSFYVSTKVGRYLKSVPDTILGGERYVGFQDYSAEKTIESVEKSLELLGVDYLDIVFVHDIQFSESYKQARNTCLLTLVSLQEAGLINYIGVSSYDLTILSHLFKDETYLMSTGVGEPRHTEVLQTVGRYNMLDRLLTSTKSIPFRFLEHTRNQEVAIINAAPLNMGLFTPDGPPVWHSAPPEVRICCKKIADLCKERGVDIVRIALFFALKQQGIGTHLVGLATPEEVYNAVDVMHSSLTEEEANCLNISLGMIEELECVTWRERDAVITGTGNVSDKAVSATHYTDAQIHQTGYISGHGQLKFSWKGKHGHADTPG
eukprot:TRINITY_DN858_c0_g2_i1.p1 TRINITY_DN858_c0_g2~~TRINITY_DN858_c0_g2_i1.p1  ORF type:complete len:481 (+),score=73.88 TRINITY_DN858_c0_g2_i1:106-1548(+)